MTESETLVTPMTDVHPAWAAVSALAGEMVGGLFYFNYPGGSGLTNGAVFGRIAGRNAASASDRS